MKKQILLFLIFASQPISALIETNKNFLMPRPAGRELYIDQASWHLVKRDADSKHKCNFGGTAQFIGFYKESTSKRDLGAYFGVRGKNSFDYGHGSFLKNAVETEDIFHNAIDDNFTFTFNGASLIYLAQDNPALTGATFVTGSPDTSRGFVTSHPTINPLASQPSGDVTQDVLIASGEYQKKVANDLALKGTFTMMPKRKEYGFKFSYYSTMKEHYILKIDIPFIRVDHEMQAKVTDERVFTDPETEKKVSLLDIVSGNYSKAKKDSNNKDEQAALKFAKITTSKQTENKVGDLDLSIGYLFANHEKYDLAGYIRLTAPTSTTVSAENLFPPIVGNGGHIELALGIDSTVDLTFNGQETNVECLATLFAGYIFHRNETRTLDSFLDRGIRLPWQKYSLVAKNGSSGALEHLANVATFPVEVTPGFKAEGSFAACYRYGPVLASLGYSFFARQGEKIKIEKWPSSDQYSFVAPTRYRTDIVFDPAVDGLDGLDSTTITQEEMDPKSASTPAVFYNTIFANASVYSTMQVPFVASLGVSYDFSQDNSSIENYGVWVKLAITF